MATGNTLLRLAILAAASTLLVPAADGQELTARGQPVDLQPGVAVVEGREQRRIRLRLDPTATVYPAQLQGRTIVIRRPVRKVYAPQSSRPFAEDWHENGTACVLPIHQTGGALLAELIWEDEKHPVKERDRVELCHIPPEADKPWILSLDCVAQKPATGPPVAAPAEVLWLKADILCPTRAPHQIEWTTDAGEFLYAGGTSAGNAYTGSPAARWRAPTEAGPSGSRELTATIHLKVAIMPEGKAAERTLAIRVVQPKGPYTEVRTLASQARASKDGQHGPVLSDASLVAAGPLGSVYVFDSPGRRLLHWNQGIPSYVPLGSSQVAALASAAGAAYLVHDGSVARCEPGAGAPAKLAALPAVKRLVGIAFNAAGDVCVLDSGAPPRLHTLAGAGGGSWREAPLGPAIDSPWLTAFCVDPQSSDLYIYDSRDRMIRQWRALHGTAYGLLGVPITAGNLPGQLGAPVAVLPRLGCDRRFDLPIQVVFANGAVTEKWSLKGDPPKWSPIVSATPPELSRTRFVARNAARAADGDVLLCGQATVHGDTAPRVVQLSPTGKFRRMLPLPPLPPTFVAVAPNGLRYLLLRSSRRRKAPEHLIVVGPDSWVVRDVGPVESCQSIVSVRADRSSPTHVLLVGQKQRRVSAFRLDVADPSRRLELSSAGLPGRTIPKHDAVDVASSPKHIAVLDRDGKVLLFANKKPITYLCQFDSGLRRPRAIAVLSALAPKQAPSAERQSYVCVLPSGKQATSVHLWRLRRTGGDSPEPEKLGAFPDPKRVAAEALLSSPVAMDSAFPDHQGMLYVLDGGGTRLRAFDVAEIGRQMSQRLPPQIASEPLIANLPFKGEGLDLAVGPGGVLHIVDPQGETVHTYARRP